jgi:aminoglycoside phosphotransferase (APT) family kinase protein
MGFPSDGYPWHWSVYRWLEGENATIERIADLQQFATALAQFLAALQRINPAGGPPLGSTTFSVADRWQFMTLKPATQLQPCTARLIPTQ